MAGIAETSLTALAATFALTLVGFWIWMLVDCLNKESREGQDRLIWTLVIVFTKILGAALYYFLRYRRRANLVDHNGPTPAV